MSRKRIATISVAAALAAASAGVAAGPAGAVPKNPSPGACQMFNVFNSAVGFAGMAHSENGQGLENMELLLRSVAARREVPQRRGELGPVAGAELLERVGDVAFDRLR